MNRVMERFEQIYEEHAGAVRAYVRRRAPESMVEDVVDALRRLAPIEVTIMDGLVERVEFRLPAELVDCVA